MMDAVLKMAEAAGEAFARGLLSQMTGGPRGIPMPSQKKAAPKFQVLTDAAISTQAAERCTKCESKARSLGLCSAHYQAARRAKLKTKAA